MHSVSFSVSRLWLFRSLYLFLSHFANILDIIADEKALHVLKIRQYFIYTNFQRIKNLDIFKIKINLNEIKIFNCCAMLQVALGEHNINADIEAHKAQVYH